MATLDQLPLELLATLLGYLSGDVVARVACTCQRLKEASNIESVWQTMCKRVMRTNTQMRQGSGIQIQVVKPEIQIYKDSYPCNGVRSWSSMPAEFKTQPRTIEFGISKISTDIGVTFRELYTKILYRYGSILGVWQPDVGPYGGLIHVKFVGDHIEGINCHPPINPHATSPLRMRLMFSIRIGGDDRQVMFQCHGGHGDAHACDVSQLRAEPDVFSTKCSQPEVHQHPRGKDAEFSEWLNRETDNMLQNFLFHGHELLLMKFLITSQFEIVSNFIRLQLPVPSQTVFEIIRPGLFKASYGCHGVEMLTLAFDDAHETVIVKKISGDPNVPAGQISIKADLKRPMILTEEQQGSIQMLREMDTPDLPEEMTLNRLPVQPFRIPADCTDRESNPPSHCMARFHSQGQIAGHDFTNPSFIPGHFIVFDEDTFGHIWMNLRSFSLFSRVKEQL